jgi:hypothetical protein
MKELEKHKPMLICCKCGIEFRTFDSYNLDYKLAGQDRGKKLHFCSLCWNESKLQHIVDQIKEVENQCNAGLSFEAKSRARV